MRVNASPTSVCSVATVALPKRFSSFDRQDSGPVFKSMSARGGQPEGVALNFRSRGMPIPGGQANDGEIRAKGVTAPVICGILIRADAERYLSNHVASTVRPVPTIAMIH
jgi:hypothetical protein